MNSDHDFRKQDSAVDLDAKIEPDVAEPDSEPQAGTDRDASDPTTALPFLEQQARLRARSPDIVVDGEILLRLSTVREVVDHQQWYTCIGLTILDRHKRTTYYLTA